ncbi:DNA helicase RecG [bacterium]|nr:MAG: DNA helicase RecG [bacterium]
MPESHLATSLQSLKGIGGRAAPAYAKLGLYTVGDLIFHLPRRYEDRRNLPKIGDLRPGDWATIRGRVRNFEARPTRGGMVVMKAIVGDGTGAVALTWFNQPWIRRQLEGYEGEILAYGQVKDGGYNLEIASPEWELINPEDGEESFARIFPVYPLTDGIQQKSMRKAVRAALELALPLDDPLPASLKRSQNLMDLDEALRTIHAPEDDNARADARRRLVFEEFFYLQVALAMRRAETHQELGIAFPIDDLLSGMGGSPASGADFFEKDRASLRDGEPLWDQIHRMLPFELTGAQKRVVGEIWDDMKSPHPMNRLVQGDVGSGKTAVAACALLAAIRSGYQGALMAPTEILAEQHAANLRRLMEPLGIQVELLVGKLSASEKKKAAARVVSGEANLAIGTHALIQEGVDFHRLGLVVIDEQHRFGVLQRKALRDKGLGNPDVLVMTATPIPRTLTMTIYGDLDVSIIDELPPGRKPIRTHWKLPSERPSVYQEVRRLLDEGRQAYFVCPMVGESEKMNAQAAEDLHYRLSNAEFADKEVGLLHGQMRPKDKEAAMDAFRKGEKHILVATTVIEVGVDVPNASVMVVEDANRFGLAQLHQLRGRVGRGEYQSFCVLVADAKGEDARARMEAMVETSDGFVIAERDLELRGPGVMAGTQQSGNADFRIADLVQDSRQLEIARQAVLKALERDPQLKSVVWGPVLEKVRERRGDLAVVSVS